MILRMYAMKDRLNGYTSPIPFPNDEMAERYLKDQALSNPTVKNTPGDFGIYYIGEYDTKLGRMIPNDVQFIKGAKAYGEDDV